MHRPASPDFPPNPPDLGRVLVFFSPGHCCERLFEAGIRQAFGQGLQAFGACPAELGLLWNQWLSRFLHGLHLNANSGNLQPALRKIFEQSWA